jgi:hypothetical protein
MTFAIASIAVAAGGTVNVFGGMIGPFCGIATWLSVIAGIVGGIGWLITAKRK